MTRDAVCVENRGATYSLRAGVDTLVGSFVLR